MAIKTLPFDAADQFRDDPEGQLELLHDAAESGDCRYIAHAIGIVARAHGMTQLERETGINRQALYKALSAEGNPTLDTLTKVLGALGLQLKIEQRELADA